MGNQFQTKTSVPGSARQLTLKYLTQMLLTTDCRQYTTSKVGKGKRGNSDHRKNVTDISLLVTTGVGNTTAHYDRYVYTDINKTQKKEWHLFPTIGSSVFFLSHTSLWMFSMLPSVAIGALQCLLSLSNDFVAQYTIVCMGRRADISSSFVGWASSSRSAPAHLI
ncbi:unnamed protein product, partial [Meganyctiphanes norvegica]